MATGHTEIGGAPRPDTWQGRPLFERGQSFAAGRRACQVDLVVKLCRRHIWAKTCSVSRTALVHSARNVQTLPDYWLQAPLSRHIHSWPVVGPLCCCSTVGCVLTHGQGCRVEMDNFFDPDVLQEGPGIVTVLFCVLSMMSFCVSRAFLCVCFFVPCNFYVFLRVSFSTVSVFGCKLFSL